MSKKSLIDLLPAFALAKPPPIIHREWITGREGKMYVRLTSRMVLFKRQIITCTSFELATLGLRECNQSHGVFTQIVTELKKCNREILFVESVQMGGWFQESLVRNGWNIVIPNSYWLPTQMFGRADASLQPLYATETR